MNLVKPTSRRIKMLEVSDSLIKQYLTTGFTSSPITVLSGIPEDSSIVGGQLQYGLCGVSLVLWIESPDFPELAEGQPIPSLVVTFQRVEPSTAP